MFKTVPQVYRDCFRLIDHIAGRSRKGDKMRALVAQQFRAHANEKDEDKIESLKRNAMSGLANYLTIESLGKLEPTNGASGIRDPRRTAAALRATLQRAGGALSDVEVDPATATVVHSAGPAVAAAEAAANGAAQSADASADDAVLDADVTPLPVRLPPMSARVAQLQAQIRANKALRLELERRAREGDSGDSSSNSGNTSL